MSEWAVILPFNEGEMGCGGDEQFRVHEPILMAAEEFISEANWFTFMAAGRPRSGCDPEPEAA